MRRGVSIGVAATVVVAWAARAVAQASTFAPETVSVGDWQIGPVIELEARGEYRHDLDDRDRGLLVERARLGIDASRGPLEARVVGQDARSVDLAGGDAVAGFPAFAFTGAYEAWAEVRTDGARPSFVRVGRQPVVWGEGRLIGMADASPAGRSLDAVRGRIVSGDGAVEILAAALEDWPSTPPASIDPYAGLVGATAEWAFDPLLAVEASGLARLARRDAIDLTAVKGQTYTVTGRMHGDGRAWSWGVEGAYQWGHVEGATRAGPSFFTGRRAAWAAAGPVAYAFERAVAAPTIRLAVAYATGDRSGSTYRAFDPMIPDVRVWHGPMDAFAWSNEAEASARAAIAPWTDGVMAIEYRYAVLAQPGAAWRSATLRTIGQAPGNTDGVLGHEIDSTVEWSPCVPVRLRVGYSALVLGDGARAILAASQSGSAHVSHWAYGEARVDF
jgi:hypothetical protein